MRNRDGTRNAIEVRNLVKGYKGVPVLHDGLKPDSARESRSNAPGGPGSVKARPLHRAVREAADGIRTHDLLHGKQNMGEGAAHNLPANRRFLARRAANRCPGFHAELRGVED